MLISMCALIKKFLYLLLRGDFLIREIIFNFSCRHNPHFLEQAPLAFALFILPGNYRQFIASIFIVQYIFRQCCTISITSPLERCSVIVASLFPGLPSCPNINYIWSILNFAVAYILYIYEARVHLSRLYQI